MVLLGGQVKKPSRRMISRMASRRYFMIYS